MRRKSLMTTPILAFLMLSIAVQVLPVFAQHEAAVDGKAYIRIGSWWNPEEYYRGPATLAIVPDPHDPQCVEWGIVITVEYACMQYTSFAWYVEDVKEWGSYKILKATPHPGVDVDGDGVDDILAGPSTLKIVVRHRMHGAWVVARGHGVYFKGRV